MLGELANHGSSTTALTTPCCAPCVRNIELWGKYVAGRPFNWILKVVEHKHILEMEIKIL